MSIVYCREHYRTSGPDQDCYGQRPDHHRLIRSGLPRGPLPQHTFTSGGNLLSLDHYLAQALVSRGDAVAKKLAQGQGADAHFKHTKEEWLREKGSLTYQRPV